MPGPCSHEAYSWGRRMEFLISHSTYMPWEWVGCSVDLSLLLSPTNKCIKAWLFCNLTLNSARENIPCLFVQSLINGTVFPGTLKGEAELQNKTLCSNYTYTYLTRAGAWAFLSAPPLESLEPRCECCFSATHLFKDSKRLSLVST